jgi:uncharacterized Fe-S cluster-containing radical SAM superfamily protein
MSTTTRAINTEKMSEHLRARAIDIDGRKILISRLGGSEQEGDLQIPANCSGYGRIRHFKLATSPGWPANPLPIVPACTALGLEVPDMMTAQVFQNAACAWRCWYCFVPYNLLSADLKRSDWLSPEELVRLYADESDRPLVIDLSGGSPDLVPEWAVWMMEALEARGLASKTFLWTDDNLSTDYLFEKLSQKQIAHLTNYRNYGRVCCFKGFDAESFTFNTQAADVGFDRQFEIMRRLLELGLDTYGYITLTGPSANDLPRKVSLLFDRLQVLDPHLPLRTVPLEIRSFSPMEQRMGAKHHSSLAVQSQAIVEWNANIERRFDAATRALSIASVPQGSKARS